MSVNGKFTCGVYGETNANCRRMIFGWIDFPGTEPFRIKKGIDKFSLIIYHIVV